MKIFFVSVIIIFSLYQSLLAQRYEYEVELEAIEISNLGGIHSFAHGQINGEWLIIGGRLDGLHQRQPFAAFDASGNNTQVLVINPLSQEVWKASYQNLPAAIKEQLSSTNMQFHQEQDKLILTGGYAFSPTANDHITFPSITIVEMESLIYQVKNNSIDASSFMQKTDQKFAVTGGSLEKIEDTFYLVGGHRFDGRYNPIGPDHGPGFEQEYTDEIRPFDLTIEEQEFVVTHLSEIHDEMHLHRRDYNMLPQIKDGNEELMIFSGVFQNTSDVPWLYPVAITNNGYEAKENFLQYFNHYHCASIPLYDEESDEMHNIFFGGIAQFYMEDDILVQDNDIPFVNTIADVTRLSDGTLIESILNIGMPGLLGAGSEFVLMPNVQTYSNGVLKGSQIGSTSVELGYIFGGIRSTAPNVFFSNTGTQSQASTTIFKVSLSKKQVTSTISLSNKELDLLIYPNPAQNIVRMTVDLNTIADIHIEVYDSLYKLVGTQIIPQSELSIGKNFLALDKLNVNYGAFLYKIKIDESIITRWVIWSE